MRVRICEFCPAGASAHRAQAAAGLSVLVVGEAEAVDDIVDEVGGDAGASSRFGDVSVSPIGA